MRESSRSTIRCRSYGSPEKSPSSVIRSLEGDVNTNGSITRPAQLELFALAATKPPKIQVEICSIPCDDLPQRLARIYALALQRYNEHIIAQEQIPMAA